MIYEMNDRNTFSIKARVAILDNIIVFLNGSDSFSTIIFHLFHLLRFIQVHVVYF